MPNRLSKKRSHQNTPNYAHQKKYHLSIGITPSVQKITDEIQSLNNVPFTQKPLAQIQSSDNKDIAIVQKSLARNQDVVQTLDYNDNVGTWRYYTRDGIMIEKWWPFRTNP